MKEEIYDDVMEEEPEHAAPAKVHIAFTKRLAKSIGWMTFESVEWKRTDSTISEWKMEYDVVDGEGSGTSFDSEEHARIYSEVVKINKRLKRMEDVMKRKK